jgi:hypothetical protein
MNANRVCAWSFLVYIGALTGEPMATFSEPKRDVPIVEETDVVVCGGGPAGVCAAIASARTGARTRLIELHGCLGGVWTAGALSWIIDSANKTGLMAEITSELERRGVRATRVPGGTNYAYDVEAMKLLLDELCLDAGVDVRLHTRVVGAVRNSADRLAVVMTESKSGREAWAAKAFVDATGDGDLGAAAGCGFDMGHPETGAVQPMSLTVLLTGVLFDEIEPFVGGGMREPKLRLVAAMARAGMTCSTTVPVLFRVRDDLFALMGNHEYGVKCDDAQVITEATLRARSEAHRIVAGLRSLGGIWSGLQMVASGAQIGVREGRRIRGRYGVTADDLLNGARHEDAVCRVTMGIDVHATDPKASKGIESKPHKSQPYDIPLRALITRDVDGLLLAGRCISGDFIAHSSYRVTGNAAAMGQAAGVCAALAAKADCLPHDILFFEVKDAMDRLDKSVATMGV